MARQKLNNTNNIGKRLRKLRKQKGFTQKELGEKIGSDGRTISLYERGKFNPAAHIIAKLSSVLNVTTDDILKETPYNAYQTDALPFQDEELIKLFIEIDNAPLKRKKTIIKLLKILNTYHKT